MLLCMHVCVFCFIWFLLFHYFYSLFFFCRFNYYGRIRARARTHIIWHSIDTILRYKSRLFCEAYLLYAFCGSNWSEPGAHARVQPIGNNRQHKKDGMKNVQWPLRNGYYVPVEQQQVVMRQFSWAFIRIAF